MKKLAIFGTGGFAKELLDLAIDQGYCEVVFLAQSAGESQKLLGFPVISEAKYLNLIDFDFVIGVADPKVRKKIYEQYPDLSYPNLVHSQSSLGYGIRDELRASKGIVIAAGARITNSCVLSDFVIVSFNCTVGHDCILDSYVSVMPGANLSGCVHLKQGVYVGTNATILPGNLNQFKLIDEYSVIGAGAVVVKNILPYTINIGTPAKELKKR